MAKRTAAATAPPQPARVANVCCAACSSRHVLATVSTNGKAAGAFWCGSCGAFFDAVARAERTAA